MPRAILAGLTISLAVGGPSLKAYAQDPSARCVSVANKQMTIDLAQGRGFYIENFSGPETVAFLKAFTPPRPTAISSPRKCSQRLVVTGLMFSSRATKTCAHRHLRSPATATTRLWAKRKGMARRSSGGSSIWREPE